ncbi:Bug family tripartite tricarboxylate transporter substrate binding protein [Falsiroseomonas tokyonensis]|uniref:Bug family tripartite tricarboxylate transporter substrate binding protein n=1 Tax=Falsiroseomonas tokyonensis TaxID=430521 RepID=A0ABV7BRF8_9PROT|nr:tripartite tricarboxylate transporter substrate-binding protein [Falsiroseomonas tokyonensis]MBU8537231.1 tripartite tricarboxylate transporter substrate binding protein [Falsiroseomonas tokyonensis]
MTPSATASTGRRRLLGTALLGAGLLPSAGARAQSYPSGPIRIVIGFGPGGLADLTARLVGEQLSQRLGQQVVVDNRPGAGGAVAARLGATAPPDGQTLMILSTGNAINKSLFKSLPYDPVADFTAISALVSFDLLLLTGAESALRSVPDVLAAGRGGRSLAIGTISPGSTQNLAAEWLRVAAGLDATVIPYRTTPEVLTAAQRGDVQLAFESYAAARGALEGGQVRAIASTGEQRSQLLPELPTLREAGLTDYAVTGWNGLFAPARTPASIIALLNGHLREILAMPAMRARLLALGVEPAPNTPAEMASLLQRDIATWAQVIERAAIERQ